MTQSAIDPFLASPTTASRPPGRSSRAIVASAAAKSIWCSAVLAHAKSKPASANGWLRKSSLMKLSPGTPRPSSRATSIIRSSASIPVTNAHRPASLRTSIPSPHPTSTAAPHSAGTASRMTRW